MTKLGDELSGKLDRRSERDAFTLYDEESLKAFYSLPFDLLLCLLFEGIDLEIYDHIDVRISDD